MNFFFERNLSSYEYKIDAKLNEAKSSLNKAEEIARQLGIFAGDIEKMKRETLAELQKILLTRS